MAKSSNALDNLFGSRIRVKILKYIFRNYPGDFNISELSRRIQEPSRTVKTEVDNLLKLGLLKSKNK